MELRTWSMKYRNIPCPPEKFRRKRGTTEQQRLWKHCIIRSCPFSKELGESEQQRKRRVEIRKKWESAFESHLDVNKIVLPGFCLVNFSPKKETCFCFFILTITRILVKGKLPILYNIVHVSRVLWICKGAYFMHVFTHLHLEFCLVSLYMCINSICYVIKIQLRFNNCLEYWRKVLWIRK